MFTSILIVLLTVFPAINATGNTSSTELTSAPTSENSVGESASNTVDRLYFKDLRQWRMGSSQIPENLKKHDGEIISIVGFMVPFDSIEKIDRFILLQAPFMGCLHVPPPQPNETLMINSQELRPDYVYEPIRITGRLSIEETYVDRFLVSLYTIDALRIDTVRQDDAELEDLPANFHFYGDF